MTSRHRLRMWVGVGTSVLVGSAGAGSAGSIASASVHPSPAAAEIAAPAGYRLALPHRWESPARWQRLLAQAESGYGEGGALCDLGRGEGGEQGEHGEHEADRDGKMHGHEDADTVARHHPAAQAGEGGEGGESGSDAAEAFTKGRAERVLACLRMIEGHLLVGQALYAAGDQAMAATHFAHPSAEIFEGIEHALEHERAEAVEDTLRDLHQAALKGVTPAALEAPYRAARKAVDAAAEAAAGAAQAQSGAALRVALTILKQAAHDYAEAEHEGRLANAMEYQDAWGFLRAAQGVVVRAEADLRHDDADGTARLQSQLSALVRVLHQPKPPGTLPPASQVYGLVARIEIAAAAIADVYSGKAGEGGEGGESS